MKGKTMYSLESCYPVIKTAAAIKGKVDTKAEAATVKGRMDKAVGKGMPRAVAEKITASASRGAKKTAAAELIELLQGI